MLTLLLTRHGLTDPPNVMLGGQLDVPLTPEGRRQAEALARRLEGVRVDRIVASPMLRALETAQIVATGRPIEVDERLRELDYGRWEGLTYPEIDARDPDLRQRWENDPASHASPGGESGNDVGERARGFLESLLREANAMGGEGEPARQGTDGVRRSLRDPAGGGTGHEPAPDEPETELRILVVAHGTFNRVLLAVALGVPVRDYRRRLTQDRANLTVLQYERGGAPDEARLVLLNDVAHLRGPGEVPWS